MTPDGDRLEVGATPEPDTEPGCGDFGVLPDRARLRRLTRAERHELRDLAADWTGPLVESWRELVAEVDTEGDGDA
jgi:hypothetical protein